MNNKNLPLMIVCVAMMGVNTISAMPETAQGVYRGNPPAVQFDVSPPLRLITPLPVPSAEFRGGLIVDSAGPTANIPPNPQDVDVIVQTETAGNTIPAPLVSFDGPRNLSGFSPPDPVGDIGPNHYVAMSNLFFEIYDRSGVTVFGPASNNTLWSGFGGACEAENAGDPIVIYDQLADRWLLTQFTSGGPEYFNCIALSTSSDPMGTYFRWAISSGTHFPDYPKYGVGADGYYISTRDFAVSGYAGVSVYALDKEDMLAGNPNPTIISFFVDLNIPAFIGDGLLPMDIDGDTLPPEHSPHYFVGSMDDGGPYGAPGDALTLWQFEADFENPGASSFTLSDVISMSPYDTIFPCPGNTRNCIPQPGTSARLDIQSYRQRPLHRLAYRNFGTHESLVTNQSVEASPGIAGIRWWEIRSPAHHAYIFQEGTYGPGVTDGIHRWMGSAAMDGAGNMALAYSVSDAVSLRPSIYYTGRLADDPLGLMTLGEGAIVIGGGVQTGGGSRWGDYSSLNVDPLDDCTFWYTNEYFPVTSTNNWRLRVGAFRFDECGTPGFTLNVSSGASRSVCTSGNASFDISAGSIAGFISPVTLTVANESLPFTFNFAPNPITPLPGTSTLTVSDTGSVSGGTYPITINGTAPSGTPQSVNVELKIFDAAPDAPVLVSPADGAMGLDVRPTFQWQGNNAETYTIEVATDAGFTQILYSEVVESTSFVLPARLDSNTQYFWRVRSNNACGDGYDSTEFTFVTQPEFGDCPIGLDQVEVTAFDFESGPQGWTHGADQGVDTWTLDTRNPRRGSQHWHVNDLPMTSDQFLTSPPIDLPAGMQPLTLRFWNEQSIESAPSGACWDGGFLEVAVDGGPFVPVEDYLLKTDFYDGVILNGPGQGNLAWCGDPQEYLESRIDINALSGATVQFRFRLSTNSTLGRPGWDIDDISVMACSDPDLLFRGNFEE